MALANKADAMTTFDGYIRVSRVNGRSGESYRSPKDQRAIIERLAVAHGLTLGEVVTEEDVSGGKKASDRELDRLVQKVKDGESGGIIVWNVKRYSRDHADGLRTALDIVGAKGRIIAEDFQQEGLGAISMLSFALEFAQEERRQKTEIWKRATDGAIDDGVYVGKTPVGYDKGRKKALAGTPADRASQQLVKNADAVAVREAFRVRASGGSWSQAASVLEAAGVKTSSDASKWPTTSVRSLIGNPIYAGRLENAHAHHFPELACVSPDEWQRAQSVPTAPREDGEKKKRDRSSAWAILQGWVRCAGCRHAMSPTHTSKKGKTYRYYQCRERTCDARATVNAESIEASVAQAAFDFFESCVEYRDGGFVVGSDTDTEKIAALQNERDEAEAYVSELTAAVEAGQVVPLGIITAAGARAEAARAAVIAEEQARRVPVTPDEARRAFENADLAEKRTLVRQWTNGVTVERGGGWDVDFPAVMLS